MAVTIAETSGHVTETVLKSPLSPPVTMRRNDRSHSPKYAFGIPLLGQLTLTAGITTTASRLGGTVRTNDDGESGSVALYWDFENLHAGLMKAKYGEGA